MEKSFTSTVMMQNKKYSYSLRLLDDKVAHFVCEAANIDQVFLNEDIPKLIVDLPNLILAEKEYLKNQDVVIRFRLKASEKKRIEKKALEKGYKNVSSFLRDVALG